MKRFSPKSTILSIILFLLFFTFGCSTVNNEAEMSQSQVKNVLSELKENQIKWQSRFFNNYKYTYHKSCDCFSNVTKKMVITVRNNSISSAQYVDSKNTEEVPDVHNFCTVEGLYHEIVEAVAKKADKVNVTYDQDLGYPKRIFIDYYNEVEVDDVIFEVENLVAVE